VGSYTCNLPTLTIDSGFASSSVLTGFEDASALIIMAPATLTGTTNVGAADLSFHLTLRVRMRLVRAADGAELDTRVIEHHRTGHPMALWAAEDARRFRETLDAASQALALEILWMLFPASQPLDHGAGPDVWEGGTTKVK